MHELETLISSLSSAEKKSFKIYSRRYEGDKDYLLLFDILSKGKSENLAGAEAIFNSKSPTGSFDNAANYLFRVLTDQLVSVRISQDKWFMRHHSFMKARLCFERSLPEKGLQELRKTQKLAEQAQDHMLYYQSIREELNWLADAGFANLSEQELVNRQMKSKHSLKLLHQIHEHYSLYELLKHRILNEQIGLDQNKKTINDLILGELGIITTGARFQFESRKIHLLFQSFFLIYTKQYISALEVFKELNNLFEENENLWNYPPYDNLSALEGILNNLRSIKYYAEMDYYIRKLEQLGCRPYPEHFRNAVYQTLCLYRLNRSLGLKQYKSALQQIRSIDLNKADKQLELLLFSALAYFHNQQYQQANKYISQALNDNKPVRSSSIYRVCRLMHIIIHYELGNIDYLDYEIRAYKRFRSQQGRSFKIEKLIFYLIKVNPKKCSTAKKRIAFKKIKRDIEEINNSKQEEAIQKYFDFCEWIVKFFKTETALN
ncbi:hypothetical protein EDD80_101173 [Anseongella ginsenosidimutans]|uniref:Uncharacterized protein n=1 Tax=Anseongella ginsenosidimutans TaxID=496056 RepID=A0A4R3KY77_9SPHI|nr:hypothetical protein [Anseongella ginsenosidimutans]QEC51329.1 hypothetical protein FRZ59_02495 [Anseongella ginsenosidimutans]TCS89976.1 hypothetical protein EDD80_101173 [Anseongella ginsenosidimutans]